MPIRKITITNFKSFKKLEVELGKFSLFIGANASGKSNFIQIFKFLRDIIQSGLDNAISLQGGVEYLRNMNIGASENLSIGVISDNGSRFAIQGGKKAGLLGIRFYESIFDISLSFKDGESGFEIAKETVIGKFKYFRLEKKKKKIEEKESIGEGELILSRSNGSLVFHLKSPPEVPITEENLFPPFLKQDKLPPKSLIIERPFFPSLHDLADDFRSMAIYDFDPKLPKKASPITGKAELEEDGSNLSIVLKNIVENDEKKNKFCNLICELLPFVDDLNVEKFADKSLLFKLREKYFKKEYLPASFISDGTINVTALITSLYFEKKKLTIIEEPERNIHPHLISKVINMLKDASKDKRIIVTTHNPEMVRHAGLDNIFLVSRSKEGFSVISKPASKDSIKTFLKNEIGIDELFVQGLLEI